MQAKTELLAMDVRLKSALSEMASRKNTLEQVYLEVSGSQTSPQPLGSSAGAVCTGGHWDSRGAVPPEPWAGTLACKAPRKKQAGCEARVGARWQKLPKPKIF